jgi:cell pole-organizing protein PopZ
MSDQTSQEPTMEEILASIRRIISEDDAPADAAPAEAEPEAEEEAPESILPEPEPEPQPEPEDEGVLELTDKVETLGDLDVYTPASEPEPAAAYEPAPEPDLPPLAPDEALVGQVASAAAASAFGQLSASILMPADGRTLEDVVRELLRPLLKQWLDDNLPDIVQATVDKEVERIARGRVR